MAAGTAFNRHWVIALADGSIVIDFGDNLYQDLATGVFRKDVNQAGSHTILDGELAWLKRTGHIFDFDHDSVYISGLPERPINPIQ